MVSLCPTCMKMPDEHVAVDQIEGEVSKAKEEAEEQLD